MMRAATALIDRTLVERLHEGRAASDGRSRWRCSRLPSRPARAKHLPHRRRTRAQPIVTVSRFISRTWRSRAPVHRAAMPHGSTSSANTGRDSTARRMPSIHRVDLAILPTRSTVNCSDSTCATGSAHFRYFHGRSSLSTWLRAVLSQRHVDRLRSARRQDPLPEDEAPGAIPAPSNDVDPAKRLRQPDASQRHSRGDYARAARPACACAAATMRRI